MDEYKNICNEIERIEEEIISNLEFVKTRSRYFLALPREKTELLMLKREELYEKLEKLEDMP